jgi:polysaccharide chain length determinant protein (PEP-CTERM system associated)
MLRQDISASDVIAIIRRRWSLIVLLTLFGGASGFVVSHILPKRFASQTLVLVQQPAVSPALVPTLNSDNTNQRLAAMQQQILSRSRLEPVIQELGLYHKDISRVPMEDLVERLRRTITITPIQAMAETRAQNLPGFTISVVFDEPHSAQQICAKITSMFLAENLQLRKGEVTNTTEFLGKQLAEAKGKLDEQDARLAAFQRRYLGSLPDQNQTNLNLLAGLTSQLEASTQALSRAQQDKSFAESVLSQQLSAWQASQSGVSPETFDQQLAALQTQLLALQSKYTDDHPDVIKAKSDIASLKQKIADAEQQQKNAPPDKAPRVTAEPAQIQQLRGQIHQYTQVIKERTQQQEDIQKQINLYQSRVQSSPAVEQEYKLLTRDHQTALDFYNDLLKKHDQSSMSQGLEESEQAEHFRVLDAANYSDQPIFPKVPIFAGGGFAGGLALGLALTLFLESQDTSMRSERDVEIALRLPVLVSIPAIKHAAKPVTKHVSILKPEGPVSRTGTTS